MDGRNRPAPRRAFGKAQPGEWAHGAGEPPGDGGLTGVAVGGLAASEPKGLVLAGQDGQVEGESGDGRGRGARGLLTLPTLSQGG